MATPDELFEIGNYFRPILSTETAKNASDNENTYGGMRLNFEELFKSIAGPVLRGSITQDPPNDTTGVATDDNLDSSGAGDGRSKRPAKKRFS